jgi:hypothetical protein
MPASVSSPPVRAEKKTRMPDLIPKRLSSQFDGAMSLLQKLTTEHTEYTERDETNGQIDWPKLVRFNSEKSTP